ncbi:MAG TPA: Maf family nucleotide pyrophosphatase [Xanthomonadaceae bacterium]|nr:Maf family nucleotide pyrophosphatase [Xanthomonadaceae bacterium]
MAGHPASDPASGPRLVLASTSPYRRELLARLRLSFTVARPEVDETPGPGESPALLAARLAAAKAATVAATAGDAWVLGSDQVADLAGRPLGKTGGPAAAVAQLREMSGKQVVFHTAVCLSRAGHADMTAIDRTHVRFRPLADDEIERYVEAEQPFDCAGSFKCEGLGIALFESITSEDPTALVGLPLIATAGLLRRAGFAVP